MLLVVFHLLQVLYSLLVSVSSTSVTDISLSRSSTHALAAFGGSFRSLLFSYLGFGNATAALWDLRPFIFLPQVVNSLPEVSWVLVPGLSSCLVVRLQGGGSR